MSAALPLPTLGQNAAGFVSLALKTAASKLTYRFATIISLVASGFAYCVFLLVWMEVYRVNPNPGPVSEGTMKAYLVSAFVANSILTLTLEMRFMQRVRMGLVVSDLLRPLGFLPFQMAQGVGDALVNFVFVVPVFVVGWWFLGPAMLAPSVGSAVLGVVSLLFAFVVSFGVSYLVVQAAFVLQSGYGVLFARAAFHQVFSGLAAPLVMFPEALRDVATALPFRHIIETPVRFWLGLVPSEEVPGLLLSQVAWGVGLLVLAEAIFRAVMRRHQVQGG
jgi:ABC-2 type transport system permease protein